MKPSIIVHGGAWDIPDSVAKAHVTGCEKAAALAQDLLVHNSSALDAVEAAVTCLEDDPTFNAGRGSVLNQAGQVEMDAIIMDGATLRSGAVAAIRHVRNPVRVARRLMERTSFSMLAGEGASRFAIENGFEECGEEELLVGTELDDYRDFKKTGKLRTREYFSGRAKDTVGACAIDSEGHTACATSTGGTRRKLQGRVGDSPLIGSGGYADDMIGAASATGWGEKIMAVVLSKTALDMLERSGDAYLACRSAVELMTSRTSGLGGVIIIDRNGRPGFYHNTPRMAFAFVNGETGEHKADITQ